ncbi:MAG: DUF2256 and DUF3253 domain-containing protein [Pseudomonadota bacterium]
MSQPAAKRCDTCGRAIEWRKKWARDWDNVRYCSKGCRGGPGPEGLALEAAILELLEQRKGSATICPSEAARRVDSVRMKALMEPVRQAARRLEARGVLDITQKGRVVDPSTAKGPIRLRKRTT